MPRILRMTFWLVVFALTHLIRRRSRLRRTIMAMSRSFPAGLRRLVRQGIYLSHSQEAERLGILPWQYARLRSAASILFSSAISCGHGICSNQKKINLRSDTRS